MNLFIGTYTFGELIFGFFDKELGNAFSQAYGLSCLRNSVHITGTPKVFIYGNNPYRLLFPNDKSTVLYSRERVFGVIDSYLDTLIRSSTTETICTLHGSSSSFENKAIICIGLSNKGKTTLALELAKRGDGFLGDEYAFLNLTNGDVSHERYPVQIKLQLNDLDETDDAITLSNLNCLTKTIFPNKLGIPYIEKSQKLRSLVFPEYNRSINHPLVSRVKLHELPSLLMQSVAGGRKKPELFRSLLRVIAENDTVLLKARYCSAENASGAILKYLSTE